MGRIVLHVLSMLAVLLVTTAAFAALPAAGSVAPAFALPDQDGKTVQLADYRGRWVVVYFYPKDDTPGCTQEACNFRDDVHRISAFGAQVLGISLDDSASHAAFARKYRLPFPLLADTTAEVAKRYGVVSDWLVTRFAKRCTFLVDPQGRIARVYEEVDPARHSGEILADLKRLTQAVAR